MLYEVITIFLTHPGRLLFELSATEEFSKLMVETDTFPTNYYFDLSRITSYNVCYTKLLR